MRRGRGAGREGSEHVMRDDGEAKEEPLDNPTPRCRPIWLYDEASVVTRD